ncbi:MAG: LytTR family DNA-binding domain-containing protein [Kofleriaceae bacterium]
MMRVITVDDEPLAREGLRQMLVDHPEVEVVGEAGNGSEALRLVEALAPDLLFVDVQMPEMSGLELVAALPAHRTPAIIFLTAYDEFAVRAFDVHALDYLVKPIDDRRFAEAIRRARVHCELATPSTTQPARLAIRDGEAVVFVRIDEIDWVEAADYYVEIHAGPRTYLHRETLQRLQTMLDPDRFVRIHRSRLVNRERVREIRWETRGEMVVITTSGASLKVARSCRAKLRDVLAVG